MPEEDNFCPLRSEDPVYCPLLERLAKIETDVNWLKRLMIPLMLTSFAVFVKVAFI